MADCLHLLRSQDCYYCSAVHHPGAVRGEVLGPGVAALPQLQPRQLGIRLRGLLNDLPRNRRVHDVPGVAGGEGAAGPQHGADHADVPDPRPLRR